MAMLTTTEKTRNPDSFTARRVAPEESVHSAMDYLRDSAFELGKARKRAKHAEHLLAHTEALLFKASSETSDAKRKADARTHTKWLEAAHEDADATGELAKLYALREAAAAVCEAWRTEQATLRSMKL